MLLVAMPAFKYRVTQVSELELALKAALSLPRPTIVDVHVNPNELIMLTKINASILIKTDKRILKTLLSNDKNT